MHWVLVPLNFPCGQFQTWPVPLFGEPTKQNIVTTRPILVYKYNTDLREEALKCQENSNQTSKGVAMTNGLNTIH